MFHIRDHAERFPDRFEAGALLAKKLSHYTDDPRVIVLGLPRGGIPVAYEIARALHAPLDSFEVRKLGVPGHEELAMGAIGSGGASYLNAGLIARLRISRAAVAQVATREHEELERREELYRDGRARLALTGKVVILVDDGIATGSSMLAAVTAIRRREPARIVVAVPVAPAESLADLTSVVDEVVCWTTPEPFYAVGAAYADFAQVSDDEVRTLLARASTMKDPG